MSTVITQTQLAELIAKLTNLGDRLEAAHAAGVPGIAETDWFIAARGAAVLESLRNGFCTIEAEPMFMGFDLAAGRDMTVMEVRHA